MKTIQTVFIFLFSAALAAADITTFNGKKANWGWSGKDHSEEDVVRVLETHYGKLPPLELQSELDKVTDAEFLWKISGDLVKEADASNSSYIVGGARVTNVKITLQSDGKGEIRLYSQGSLVGRVRCHSSATRQGKGAQLATGTYKVSTKEEIHISKEFKGAKMPCALCIDAVRGIYIHIGSLAPSGGCIRVSKPVGTQLFSLIPTGTPVEMVLE